MRVADALAQLQALADPDRARDSAAYHKVDRPYLGLSVPQITDLADSWRAALDVPGRVALAQGLWDTNIHEARIAAAKLLVQARIRPDQAVWDLIASWVPEFDGWAIADHVAAAGGRRVVADPTRLDQIETWITVPHLWTRRAALVFTLAWTKQNFPKPQELAIRDRILGWCATLAEDREWFIQKAVAWWLRDLSRHDPNRVRVWLEAHGARLKPWARKEAMRHLPGAD